MTASELIITLMNDHKMTQVEIAKAMGCNQSAVSKYKNNKDIPSLKYTIGLIKLAKRKKIKVKLEDLVTN